MSILVARSLHEAHGWQVSSAESVKEVVRVILMVGLVCLTNHRGRPKVLRVGRRLVVHERLVVRNVVLLVRIRDYRSMRAIATRRLVRVGPCQVESAFKEAPADALDVQEIADVLP